MKPSPASLLLLSSIVFLASCSDSGVPEDDSGARTGAGGSPTASNREVVEALERLRGEMSAIRRILERGTPGAALVEEAPRASSAPIGESEWADLERAAESRLVIESVSRYRARLLPDLLAAEAEVAAGPQTVQVHTIENGIPVEREVTADPESMSESVEWHRRVLAELTRVRSIEDLARWRNEFGVEPLE